jgi:hypothetical protein
MSIIHAKSITTPDLTGTVTVGPFPNTSTIAATDLVRPSDWVSGHDQFITLAGNTAGVSTLSGTNIVLAGGNNVTLSADQGASIATISISAGADTVDQISISAGTQSTVLGSLVFSNANDFSFGLDGSTITGSYTAPTLTEFVFSNSNNVSFGTNGSTVTATVTVASSLTAANISAGTTSNNLSAMTFANGNGVSFGLDGSTITASVAAAAANTISYWDNIAALTNTAPASLYGAAAVAAYIQPAVIPAALSISYVRIPVTVGLTSTSFTTAANTSYAQNFSAGIHIGVYTQNNATRLSLLASSSVTSQFSAQVTAGVVGSQYTVNQTITYPVLGATSSFTHSYATNLTRIDLYTTQFSDFAGFRHLDIPFATSLAASNYWIAVGGFSSAGTTGTANITDWRIQASAVGIINSNAGMADMGAGTASSDFIRFGQGQILGAAGALPNSRAYSAISTISSHLAPGLAFWKPS